MPAAIANAKRTEIIQRHQGGESLRSISDELTLSYNTVKKIWHHWEQTGKVEPNYKKASQRGTRKYGAVYEAVIELKMAHPRWGGELILLELRKSGRYEQVPSVRSVQRWFQAAGIKRPKGERQPRAQAVGRGKAVHQVWAVDAKEKLKLADGTGASWLVVSDEHSGAMLHTAAFPPQTLESGVSPQRSDQSEGSI